MSKVADEQPVIYVGIYKGPEDGSSNIKNDPFLKREDPIQSSLYVTRAMCIAKGELVIRDGQKIIKTRQLDLTRPELDLDEGSILYIKDDRAEISAEKVVVTDLNISFTVAEGGGKELSFEVTVESYENSPHWFGREVVMYNGS